MTLRDRLPEGIPNLPCYDALLPNSKEREQHTQFKVVTCQYFVEARLLNICFGATVVCIQGFFLIVVALCI